MGAGRFVKVAEPLSRPSRPTRCNRPVETFARYDASQRTPRQADATVRQVRPDLQPSSKQLKIVFLRIIALACHFSLMYLEVVCRS